MKKIAFLLMAAPSLVFAAGNTISFRGQVSDQTCQISVDGASSALVLLPTVAKSVLSSDGKVAGETPFTVSVSGCSASSSTSVPVKTTFAVSSSTSGGNIVNVGSATNVSLQLLDKSGGNAVRLVGGAPSSVSGLVLPSGSGGTASQVFAVRYVAEGGAATAGSVIGSVQYSLDYL